MNRKERNSSFELLRIISMLLIIMSHIRFNGALIENQTNFTYLHFFRMFGQTAVMCYILTSAYFLSKSKFKLTSFLRLVTKTVVMMCLLAIFSNLFVKLPNGGGIEAVKIDSFEKFMNYIIFLDNSEYWFIGVYLVTYLIFPFINIVFTKTTKKQLLCLILTLFTLIVFLPSISQFQWGNNHYIPNMFWYLFIYLVGGYIRYYPEDFKNLKIIIVGFIITFAICVFNTIFNSIYYKSRIEIFQNSTHVTNFIMSIFLFLIFSHIKMKNNKTINLIASTTLGIYLLHENRFSSILIWDTLFGIQANANYSSIFLVSITAVISTFIICALIDILVEYLIINPIFILLNKKFKNQFDKVNNFMPYTTVEDLEKFESKEKTPYNIPKYMLITFFIGLICIWLTFIPNYPLNGTFTFVILLALIFITYKIIKYVKNKNNKIKAAN